MKKLNFALLIIMTVTINSCSIFGDNGVEIAPYEVIKKEQPFDIRHYKELVIVTTAMSNDGSHNSSFKKLFNYISGKNDKSQKISMTAPVFIDPKPNKNQEMSFVLPLNISYANAPKPQDPHVKLQKITNYTVAAITFSGRLSDKNIVKNSELLKKWIKDNKLQIIGSTKVAGYNSPFTIPAFRRNEILIPISQ